MPNAPAYPHPHSPPLSLSLVAGATEAAAYRLLSIIAGGLKGSLLPEKCIHDRL